MLDKKIENAIIKIEREGDKMKRVVYEIYDKKGKYFITVATEAKKKEAEKIGFTAKRKVVYA